MTDRSREARWISASRPRWSSPGVALIARGSAPPRGPCPASSRTAATSASRWASRRGRATTRSPPRCARQGFYAGAPVGSGDCIGCHQDVAAQWASSAHRFSSFNNPYYRVATDAFREEKGAVASRFCGNCHEPFLVATGAMDRPRSIAARAPRRRASPAWSAIRSPTSIARATAATRPTCARCRPPRALHGARLRPALMSQALFCAACHKVGLGTDVTAGERWLRGQNDYDAWHISAVSGNGAGSVYRPEAAKRCQDCHMPLEPAVQGDAGAKNGMVRSHRFLGANTALPHLRGDAEQERARWRTCAGARRWRCSWSGPSRVDALMRARGVGHRLPGGTMDSNEVWLEVTAFDAAGKVIARSGGARARRRARRRRAPRARAAGRRRGARRSLRRDPAAPCAAWRSTRR